MPPSPNTLPEVPPVPVIQNSGLIRSHSLGVEIDTAPGFTTIIDNAAIGTIKGLSAAILTIVGHIRGLGGPLNLFRCQASFRRTCFRHQAP
jgi:hypothetical protein